MFRKSHEKLGTPGNKTTLRLLYYPVVKELKEGQLRLGEHTDYGTITLLFQDQVGGLEVRKANYIVANFSNEQENKTSLNMSFFCL